MKRSNYQHFFCHFCKSPMDDDDYYCVDCAVDEEDRGEQWEDEREWYVLKDDEVVAKYIKDELK